MSKDSLGRRLEEISDAFLSKQNNKKKLSGFSSIKLRYETCDACSRIIKDSDECPKCIIFTLENEKHDVHHMETISPICANYCEYFRPAIHKNSTHDFLENGKSSGSMQTHCEIEENVAIRKNIAFQNSGNAQQNMLNSLSKYLKENYSITKIELIKTDNIIQPGNKKYIEKQISIFVKDHPSDSS
jgi:hypothetical protein